jgi:hypothetical protein
MGDFLGLRSAVLRRMDQLRADNPERGDVPGWVLVTLMTAGLVVALWAVAGPALTNVFNTSIQRVLGM